MVCFTDQKSSRNNLWSDVVVLIVIPISFFFLRAQYIIHTTSTPPADFGNGSMFDKIAPRYDITNRFLALNMDTSWRKLMVREVVKDIFSEETEKQKEEVQMLDLATGTADVAILMAKEIQSQSPSKSTTQVNIIGVDPSANMIDIGNQKIDQYAKSQTDSNIHLKLQLGDARKLNDFADATFHGATMAFGIRNVPEKEEALCEIHRVLKHDSSKLAILEFSEPDEHSGILGSIARFFIRNIVPIVGATLSGAPREYMHLQNSIQEFPSPSNFVKLMEGLDCRNSKYRKGKSGKFRVDALHQLNFGSVQLYVATPYFS